MFELIHQYSELIIFILLTAIVFICVFILYTLSDKENIAKSRRKGTGKWK